MWISVLHQLGYLFTSCRKDKAFISLTVTYGTNAARNICIVTNSLMKQNKNRQDLIALKSWKLLAVNKYLCSPGKMHEFLLFCIVK